MIDKEIIMKLAKQAGINFTPAQFSGVLEDEIDEFELEEFTKLVEEYVQGKYIDTAIELRRLHQSETEAWRYADELEQERKKHKLQVLQLIDAIEDLMYWDNGKPEWEDARDLIKEIREKNDE